MVIGGDSRRARDVRSKATVDTIPVTRSGESGSLVVFIHGSSPRLAKNLRVFSRPRTAADQLPSTPLDTLTLVPISDANLQKSRLLVSGYGVRIYGVPADNGALCRIYVPDVGGNCDSVVYHGGYPELDLSDRNRVLVSGLAADDVTRVDVRVGQSRNHARLGRNAYLYELPRGVTHPDAVVVRQRGGRRHLFRFVVRTRSSAVPIFTGG